MTTSIWNSFLQSSYYELQTKARKATEPCKVSTAHFRSVLQSSISTEAVSRLLQYLLNIYSRFSPCTLDNQRPQRSKVRAKCAMISLLSWLKFLNKHNFNPSHESLTTSARQVVHSKSDPSSAGQLEQPIASLLLRRTETINISCCFRSEKKSFVLPRANQNTKQANFFESFPAEKVYVRQYWTRLETDQIKEHVAIILRGNWLEDVPCWWCMAFIFV